ncbi:hypothetical protein BJ508DRAFT_312355 [Ascobolus immersus RN42]|uniref:Uncharacterized protein n=1 Tax=Ascobolus immersus RN42 TaxID=1160509 RepID=A0A3N4HQ06_ASCIM|nr:hypothetical protein BJ508DRAFT_312355 [Ascobolus immersus RN42]
MAVFGSRSDRVSKVMRGFRCSSGPQKLLLRITQSQLPDPQRETLTTLHTSVLSLRTSHRSLARLLIEQIKGGDCKTGGMVTVNSLDLHGTLESNDTSLGSVLAASSTEEQVDRRREHWQTYRCEMETEKPSVDGRSDAVIRKLKALATVASFVDTTASWTVFHQLPNLCLEAHTFCIVCKIAFRHFQPKNLVFKIGKTYILMLGEHLQRHCIVLGVEGEEEDVRRMLVEYVQMEDTDSFDWAARCDIIKPSIIRKYREDKVEL